MSAQQWKTPPTMEIDPKKTYSAVVHTDKGDIEIKLHADKTPKTVTNFVFLAKQGFYNDTIFHRQMETLLRNI